MALLKIDEPFTGGYIKPILIDSLWSFFGLVKSESQVKEKLNGKEVTIYGWGQTEDGIQSDQLMKQDVEIGWTLDNVLTLVHKNGHGACNGDSGGIHKRI